MANIIAVRPPSRTSIPSPAPSTGAPSRESSESTDSGSKSCASGYEEFPYTATVCQREQLEPPARTDGQCEETSWEKVSRLTASFFDSISSFFGRIHASFNRVHTSTAISLATALHREGCAELICKFIESTPPFSWVIHAEDDF